MTWRENITKYDNARNIKPDSRFDQTRFPHAHRLTRGKIYNLDLASNNQPTVEKRHAFHFLTNPWELTLGYNVNSSVDLTNPNNTAMLDMPSLRAGLLSVSFNTLLDRTYEVWDGSLPEGVLHDIVQLEKVLGMPDRTINLGGGVNSPLPALGGATHTLFPGVIIKRPVRILFGGRHAYSFDGYVSSLSVTLMKFNTKMVPTRAGVNLTVESWGDADSGGGGASFGDGAHSTPQGSSAPGESYGLNPFTGDPIGGRSNAGGTDFVV